MPAHERELLTLQKQAKKGTLRAALVRRRWLVPLDEVERYAREHQGAGRSPAPRTAGGGRDGRDE